MEDKEKIEELLENYKKLKAKVEVKLNKKYREYSIKGASFPKLDGGGKSKHSDVERYITNKYSLGKELESKIKVRNIIEAAYESLPANLKEIVQYLYFENEGIVTTAQKTGWSEDTIRRRRKEILKLLKEAGILEAWDIFEEIIV